MHKIVGVLVGGLLIVASMFLTADRGVAETLCNGTVQDSQTICVSTEQLDFDAAPGEHLATRTLVVENLTPMDQSFGGVVLAGPEAFDVVQTNCRLATGTRGVSGSATCEITVGFVSSAVKPTGQAAATLLITSPTNPGTTCQDASGCLATVQLVGKPAR